MLLLVEDMLTSIVNGALVRVSRNWKASPSDVWLFPTGLTYLGFITEGKLAAIFITPSLGVSNWPVIYIINTEPPTSFLAPLPGKFEEEEAPTSTTFSHVNYAPAKRQARLYFRFQFSFFCLLQ
jgi:hypothetical protein